MQKTTRSNRQHTTQRPATIKKTPELSSSRGRQRKRSTSQTDDPNATMTNMGGLLRSRGPNRRSTPSTKPIPLTPNPSRNQTMLNDSKKINISLQGQVSMCEPTPNIENFDRHRSRKRTRVTSSPQEPKYFPPPFFQRVPTIQKNPRRRKRGLTFFSLQFLQGAPLFQKTIHA